jgi:hypothetical protein
MMTDNEHEKSSWVAQAHTGQGIDPLLEESNKEPVIDEMLKQKIMKLGYIWLGYTAFVTLIILLTPKSLLSWSVMQGIVDTVVSKMPYIAYLATLSDFPEVVKFGYAIACLSGPGHILFVFAIIVMSYLAGYTPDNRINGLCIISWIIPLMIWFMYFTCAFCRVPASKYALFEVSSRLSIAFIGQGLFFFLPSLSVGPYLLIIIRWLRSKNWKSTER